MKAFYFFMVFVISIVFFGCANVCRHVSRGNQKTLVESVAIDTMNSLTAIEAIDEKIQEKLW